MFCLSYHMLSTCKLQLFLGASSETNTCIAACGSPLTPPLCLVVYVCSSHLLPSLTADLSIPSYNTKLSAVLPVLNPHTNKSNLFTTQSALRIQMPGVLKRTWPHVAGMATIEHSRDSAVIVGTSLAPA